MVDCLVSHWVPRRAEQRGALRVDWKADKQACTMVRQWGWSWVVHWVAHLGQRWADQRAAEWDSQRAGK